MANNSSNISASKELITWLGGLLMALVAGEDLRVRHVIARAVTRARSGDDLEFKTRWPARHSLAANPPVE
jgi:hypothetical protein